MLNTASHNFYSLWKDGKTKKKRFTFDNVSTGNLKKYIYFIWLKKEHSFLLMKFSKRFEKHLIFFAL